MGYTGTHCVDERVGKDEDSADYPAGEGEYIETLEDRFWSFLVVLNIYVKVPCKLWLKWVSNQWHRESARQNTLSTNDP